MASMARHGAKMPASFQIDKGRYNSRLVVSNNLFQRDDSK